jgi:hypothetical protein
LGSDLRLASVPASCARERLERLAGLDENRLVARRQLIAPQDHIDVERIELGATADATGLVGCDECRAGAEERVDDDVAAAWLCKLSCRRRC